MRYYRIEIFTKTTTVIESSNASGTEKTTETQTQETKKEIYSSHQDNGQMNAGALNVVFNLAISFYHNTAWGASYVQIQGLPLKLLSQAYDFKGKHIRIYGGMTKDYMVEKDNYGLLLNGIIASPHGNWSGTNQTLSFYFLPEVFDNKREITLYREKDQEFSKSIELALKSSYPEYKIVVDVSAKGDFKALLKHGNVAKNLEDFARAVNEQSEVYKTNPIRIYERNNTIFVSDKILGQTTQLKTIDFIGQPVWTDNGNISSVLVMRPDIGVNDVIVFPKETSLYGKISPTNDGANYYFNRGTDAGIRNNPIFQGRYVVISVQHLADYKSASPNDWATVITVSPISSEYVVDIKRQDGGVLEMGGVY